MPSFNRVSDLGTRGVVNHADGSIVTADLAANAVTQAKLDTAVPLSGMRNFIINGGFDIWQRNSGSNAVTVNTTTTYYADRWAAYRATNTGYIVSRQSAGLEGFQYCIRMLRDSATNATNAMHIYQSLETVNSIPLAGKQVTLSFYARAGAGYTGSGSYVNVGLNTGTGTDQNMYSGYTGNVSLVSENKTITTTWARYSVTATVASNATELGVSFTSYASGNGVANDYVEITGVQLEVGPQPTPFERRPYGVELALCQRYFEKNCSIETTVGSAMGMSGYMASCNYNDGWPAKLSIPFKVNKRSNPNVVLYGPSGQNSGWWVYALNGTQYAARGSYIVLTNETYFLVSVSTWNGSSGTFGYTAGLSYYAEGAWTAEAEL